MEVKWILTGIITNLNKVKFPKNTSKAHTDNI